VNHRVPFKLVGAILAPAVLVAFVIGLVLAGVLNLRPAVAQTDTKLAQVGPRGAARGREHIGREDGESVAAITASGHPA
jgi:hypothetical protein